MNFKQLSLNERGDSLVAVMVALGLAGVLTTVIMNNMTLQNKSSKTTEIQNNINDFKRLISDFASRTEPCQASFRGSSRGEDILALKQKVSYTGAAFAEVGKEFQKSGFIITQMSILSLVDQRAMSTGDNGGLDSNGVGTAYLRIKIQKIRSASNSKFFGGGDAAVVVPIVAEFGGDDIVADGIDKDDASDAWKTKFDALEVSQDNKLLAQGIPKTDYAVSAEENKLPSSDGTVFDQANFIVVPGNVSVIWGVYHPDFPISDCGSHLSN